jgi:hypothetical protein
LVEASFSNRGERASGSQSGLRLTAKYRAWPLVARQNDEVVFSQPCLNGFNEEFT